MAIDRERILQVAQGHVDNRRYDRAVAEYQRIIQHDPNDARTLLKIGDLQARMHAYPDAIATYDRVGQFYAQKGFSLKAIAVYKQIRELIRKHAPELADHYSHILPRLAEIYRELGLTSDALAAYDEVASRFQKAGRDQAAIEIFQKMVQLDASNPLPHLRLAEACCRVQEVQEAVNSFWTAADLLLRMERPDDALKVIERILQFRQDPAFARVAGDLYLRRGDREGGLQALAKLQIAFQADPKDLDTLGLLAHAFTLIQQEAKAVEVYKEMARLAKEQKKDDLYGQLLQHLRSVAPEDDQVRALESLRPPGSAVSRSSIPISLDDDVEYVDDEDLVSEVAPAPMPLQRPIMTSAPDVVIVGDDTEVAEELGGPSSFDTSGHARKAIIDAESFRKLRLYSKAIETLHIALEIDPNSIDIRHKLRQILTDAGQKEAALQEAVNMALLFMDRGDTASAEPLLYEVIEQLPEHPEALQLLEEINGLDRVSQAPAGMHVGEERLPSYDLDQSATDDDALALSAPFGAQTDEPFGMDAPLPSFPLRSESEDDLLAGIDEEAPAAAGSSSLEGVEDVLEEAEFFAARGLYEDARAILEEQLARSPRHPLLLERLAEVKAAQSQGSVTVEKRQFSSAPPSDRAFDIAASLEALDDLEISESKLPPPTSSEGGDVDVDQVFAKFKAGVREQVAETDSSTHYDLGVAYKEMGLVADAINEFELAAKDPQRECMCFGMIGMIHLEAGRADAAIIAYENALGAKLKTREQEESLLYDLGGAYESLEEVAQALNAFERILTHNPKYRDVRDRVAKLRGDAGRPSQARAVGGDDDFADALEIFDGK